LIGPRRLVTGGAVHRRGVIGSLAGTKAAKRLSGGGHLTGTFASMIFVVAAYMLWKSANAVF